MSRGMVVSGSRQVSETSFPGRIRPWNFTVEIRTGRFRRNHNRSGQESHQKPPGEPEIGCVVAPPLALTNGQNQDPDGPEACEFSMRPV